ncbi:hypothetical protein [Rheinheimera sp. EpRS3]|uniref:hypothetical protein n=1 Tax=Rheinheimera sp. EpRS3 TaxID=1712383 RepID=UPI0007477113|nr:hypothetical protein [Rheinheimera sp. EpRS3]KUM54506.1 hypothetical protein AR688_14435 [Rheinheimera sp. EpRS3]
MRTIFLVILFLPCWSYATETINCHFDKYHQVNHEVPEMTGYTAIDQSVEIVAGTTSDKTLKLDGKKRGTNSIKWVLLEQKGWEAYSTTYAGDFGELLTIEHKLGESSKGLNGWYKASLIRSQITTTHTLLGKCLVK